MQVYVILLQDAKINPSEFQLLVVVSQYLH